MRGAEDRVEVVFTSWLVRHGWCIQPKRDFIDIIATRDGRTLIAEAKGRRMLNAQCQSGVAQLIRCMNRRWLWWVVKHSRVVEAFATGSEPGLRRADPRLLFDIGSHARDVLGRHTSACQQIRLVLNLVWERIPRPIMDLGDPWLPRPEPDGPEPVPWFNPAPFLDIVAAILAIHEQLGDTREIDEAKVDEFDKAFTAAVDDGLQIGLERAKESAAQAVEHFVSMIQ